MYSWGIFSSASSITLEASRRPNRRALGSVWDVCLGRGEGMIVCEEGMVEACESECGVCVRRRVHVCVKEALRGSGNRENVEGILVRGKILRSWTVHSI
jgi:hypothetical protein